MGTKAVMIGSGGHAKVVLDILRSNPEVDIVGFIDKCDKSDLRGCTRLGSDEELPQLFKQNIRHAIIAIGDNYIRKRISERLQEIGFQCLNAISPYAVVSRSAELGSGIVLMPGSIINADARIGDHSIINTGSSVDHDCFIGPYTHIAPGCHLSGRVMTGTGAFLGVGTKVADNVTIGDWSVIGAGGVVVNDVPERSVAVGIPARVIRNIETGIVANDKNSKEGT